jgi:hypothetical protein
MCCVDRLKSLSKVDMPVSPALLILMTAPCRIRNGIYIVQLLRALSFLVYATHLSLFAALHSPVQ